LVNFIKIAFFISLATTAFILVLGLGIYFRGGELNRRYGNIAMRWRVIFQGVTLMLFLWLLSIQ
jgi:hypothetical protein